MQEEVDLAFELKFETLCTGLFMRRMVEEKRHSWVTVREWTSDTTTFLDRLETLEGAQVLVRKKESGFEGGVFQYGESLVLLQLWRGEVVLRVAGYEDDVTRIESSVKKLLPESDEEGGVPLTFWYWSSVRGSANRVRRLLRVPSWTEISVNYPLATRTRLGSLIESGVPPASGQLILFFGEPGCGKTYALRSILREWKGSFNFHYMSDTEKFFGNSDYMLSVLLGEDAGKEKLLILEDAGEFLLPDARQQMGQGLSRLLNASDGLIGQGLKSMYLITTNEPVSRLHPAISRAGRCAAQLEFGIFSPAEAQEWLAERGHSASSLDRSLRLADLYAVVRGESMTPEPVKLGF